MRALRYAARSLARTPLFTLTAIVILSLSVGAATAVFSLLYALVLRPLPIPNPHQLARVTTVDRRASSGDLTWRMYRELAANQRVFSTLNPPLDQSVLTLESDRGVERGAVAGAAGNLFSELGATPALGRLIQPADGDFTVPTGAPVAVLGWQFWQRHFFGDPNVIGQTIRVDGTPLTIVGVAPRDFLGFSITIDHDVWIPIGLLPQVMDSEVSMVHGTSRWVGTFGRLAPGVTMAAARARRSRRCRPALRAPRCPSNFGPPRKRTTSRSASTSIRAPRASSADCARATQPLSCAAWYCRPGAARRRGQSRLARLRRAESRRRDDWRSGSRSAPKRWRVIRECAAEGLWLAPRAQPGVTLAAVASDAIADFLLRDYTVRTSLQVAPDVGVITVAVTASPRSPFSPRSPPRFSGPRGMPR